MYFIKEHYMFSISKYMNKKNSSLIRLQIDVMSVTHDCSEEAEEAAEEVAAADEE